MRVDIDALLRGRRGPAGLLAPAVAKTAVSQPRRRLWVKKNRLQHQGAQPGLGAPAVCEAQRARRKPQAV